VISKGIKAVFLGFSLEGVVVQINEKWNQSYYEREVRFTDIFLSRKASNPKADKLQAMLANVKAPTKKAPIARVKGQYHVIQSGDILYGICRCMVFRWISCVA